MALEYEVFNVDANFQKQRELFTLCFPESINAGTNKGAHYQWKFQSKQCVSSQYTVSESEKLLGYYAAINFPYIINGEKHSVAMVCDVMTHPDARGRGLFTKLGAYATQAMEVDSFSFSTGYPVRPEVIPGHLKVGWIKALPLPVYILPLKSRAILSIFKLAFISPLVDIVLKLIKTIFSGLFDRADKSLSVAQYSVQDILVDTSYQTFIDDWKATVACCLDKTPEFLKWRLSAPNSNYVVLASKRDNKMTSILIGRITSLEGIPSLAILDAMALPEHDSDLGRLIKQASNIALTSDAEAIAMMTNKANFKRLRLWRRFFLPTHITFTFIIKRMQCKQADSVFTDDANWALTWLDSDDL